MAFRWTTSASRCPRTTSVAPTEANRASEVLVGSVPLRVGQTMTYVYDFGDWWEFDVTLERVDPDLVIEEAVVLEKHGEPPAQYCW